VATHRLFRRVGFAVLAGVVALATVMNAQAPTAPPAGSAPPTPDGQAQVPTFRGGVDSVLVDVIVTDRSGKPVTNLTKEDFEVKETGKLQTVDSFRLVQTDDGVEDAIAQREILSFDDQRRETARDSNRLFVLFLDDYHVRRGSSMVVKEELAKFLLTLNPHDLVAVVTPLSIMGGLTFSRNHQATASIVRDFVGRKFDYTPMNALESRYQQMGPEAQERFRNDMVVSGLRNVCDQLGGMRDGRKTVLYVSEGMSGSVPSGVKTRGGFYGPQTVQRANDQRQASQDFFETASLITQMQQVFTAATRNNVAVYTLDPRGLANFEYGIEEDVTSADDRRILQESTDLLRVVADETDGRAIVNRNNPLAALQQMVRDGSTYYLLGYVSTLAPRDGKFHQIEVKVRRPGVDVRARRGYWAYSPEDVAKMTAGPKASPPSAVTDALDTLAASSEGTRSRAVNTWAGATKGTTEKSRVTFVWEPVNNVAGDAAEVVDRLAVVAQGAAGIEVFRGTVPRETLPGGRVTGRITFDAPAGPIQLRLTAENATGRRLDTEDRSIVVPDFTGTGPLISTPFVFRGRTVRDLQQIRAAEAPVPVIRRVFSRSERVLVRFGAYGPAGSAPKVSMRLLNSQGGELAALGEPVRSGEWFEGEFGLSSFPPADYVVEITAESNGESAKELLAIRVTG
jgi:VWFA-related protein